MNGRPPAEEVALSYGMGADSTAVLLRWLTDPATRPCDLASLLVVTAMTGDEWPVTGRLVTAHILPRLREHRVRYAQVARAGPVQADGIAVLDDSRSPRRLHLPGAFRLSDELRAAGTVPQVAGVRKCSLKAKGWPIDQFLARATAGRPYLHAMGYEAGETGRARRDATYDTATRTGIYPLIAWGWDRAACERYIRSLTGADWPRSACTYCPFALCSADGRARVLAAYAADPATGARALLLEHLAVCLNPRQGLAAGERLAGILVGTGRHEAVLAAFRAGLHRTPWRLYEVRRVIRPRADDPSRPGSASRSLRAIAAGGRAEMTAALREQAASRGARIITDTVAQRAWLRVRGECYPAAEHFLVVAPAGARDKESPGFARAWAEAAAHPAHDLGRIA